MPELGLVLTETGAARARGAGAVGGDRRAERRRREIVTLAAQIERAALRLRSDPRGGWERDLELVESALPSLEAAVDSDRGAHRALGRGWFLVGLVRGLWAGQLARGEEALERALTHARAAGDRRQEAEIVGRLGFAAWSGPMPVPEAIERCNDAARRGRRRHASSTAGGRRWLASLVARQGRFDEARALARRGRRGLRGARQEPQHDLRVGLRLRRRRAGSPATSRPPSASCGAASRSSSDLGELGYRARASRPSSPGSSTARGASRRRSASPRSWRTTASEDDIWSQVLFRLTRARVLADSGRVAEAESVAREALAIVEQTDLLDLHGDTLLDLGHVLRAAGRAEESKACAEQALVALRDARANLVSAELGARLPRRARSRRPERRAARPSPGRPAAAAAAARRASAPARSRARHRRRAACARSPARRPGRATRSRRRPRAPPGRARAAARRARAAPPARGRGSSRSSRSRRPARGRARPSDRCGAAQEQLGRLVALPAVLAGIDAEIGEEAVLRGDRRAASAPGSPPRARAGPPRATARRRRRDGRRTRRRRARRRERRRGSPRPSRRRSAAAAPGPVERAERARPRVAAREPGSRRRARRPRRGARRPARSRRAPRGVSCADELDPGADDRERPAPCCRAAPYESSLSGSSSSGSSAVVIHFATRIQCVTTGPAGGVSVGPAA